MNKRFKQLFSQVLILFLFFSFLLAFTPTSFAAAPRQSTINYEAGEVLDSHTLPGSGRKNAGIREAKLVTVKITSGSEQDSQVKIINYLTGRFAFDIDPAPGDKVIVAISESKNGKEYFLADYDRTFGLYMLIALFALTLLVLGGGKQGIKTISVLVFSIVLIVFLMIPGIIKFNWNIPLITLLISSVTTIVTLIAVSGWNRKSLSAILGTIGGVTVAGILALLSISRIHLSGLASEEAIMAKSTALQHINFQEVLFAGIVLGALGAVMDVTISIASAQYELKQSCPHFGFAELFKGGINVGRDVMGTMANTLIFAYAGSSLPLILLISSQPNVSMYRLINLQVIVTEVVRALIGSIGLICAIPLTATVTAYLLSRDKLSLTK